MARIDVSTSELLEAVRTATGAHVNPDDVYTLSEISEAMSASVEAVRKKLVKLKAAGMLEVVNIPREALDGRMRPVPAYRFLKRKAKR